MIWRHRLSALGVVVVVGLAAALLVSMAMPRTIGAVSLLRGNPTYDALKDGRPVSNAELEALVESRERALASRDDADIWSELGLAYLVLSRTVESDDPALRDRFTAHSVAAGRRSLLLNPANGYGWIRLAQANLQLEGPGEATVAALEMALRTARYDRQIIFAQTELCLMLWSRLSENSRGLAREQMHYALKRDKVRLAKLAKRYVAAAIVRQALAGVPEHLQRFNEVYARL